MMVQQKHLTLKNILTLKIGLPYLVYLFFLLTALLKNETV